MARPRRQRRDRCVRSVRNDRGGLAANLEGPAPARRACIDQCDASVCQHHPDRSGRGRERMRRAAQCDCRVHRPASLVDPRQRPVLRVRDPHVVAFEHDRGRIVADVHGLDDAAHSPVELGRRARACQRDPNRARPRSDGYRARTDWNPCHAAGTGVDARDHAVDAVRDPPRVSPCGQAERAVTDFERADDLAGARVDLGHGRIAAVDDPDVSVGEGEPFGSSLGWQRRKPRVRARTFLCLAASALTTLPPRF
jgi:hypothetical protein